MTTDFTPARESSHEVVYVTVADGRVTERIFDGTRDECIAACDDQNTDDATFGLFAYPEPVADARCRVRDLATGAFEPETVVKANGRAVFYGTHKAAEEFVAAMIATFADGMSPETAPTFTIEA